MITPYSLSLPPTYHGPANDDGFAPDKAPWQSHEALDHFFDHIAKGAERPPAGEADAPLSFPGQEVSDSGELSEALNDFVGDIVKGAGEPPVEADSPDAIRQTLTQLLEKFPELDTASEDDMFTINNLAALRF